MQKQIFILTDHAGEVIAATSVMPANQEPRTYMVPKQRQKLYIVSVSEEIAGLMTHNNGDEFHKAITKHFESKDTKRTLLTAASHPMFFPSAEIEAGAD